MSLAMLREIPLFQRLDERKKNYLQLAKSYSFPKFSRMFFLPSSGNFGVVFCVGFFVVVGFFFFKLSLAL